MNQIRSFQKVDRMYVETGIGNIFLVPGSGNEVVVRAEHVAENFRCEQQETLLKVLDGRKESYHGFRGLKRKFCKRSKIVIEVPSTIRLQKLDVEIGIGSICFNGNWKCGLGLDKTISHQSEHNIKTDCGIGKINISFKKRRR